MQAGVPCLDAFLMSGTFSIISNSFSFKILKMLHCLIELIVNLQT